MDMLRTDDSAVPPVFRSKILLSVSTDILLPCNVGITLKPTA